MDRSRVLKTAHDITMGDRRDDYGDPADTHQRIADTFNAARGKDLTAEDAAIFMVCVKLCRTKDSPLKADNYIDGAAYFGIAAECAKAEG